MYGKAAIKEQLGGPIIEVHQELAHPLAEECRQRVHDEMLTEMEHHSPEGEEAPESHNWTTFVIAAALQVLMIGAGVTGLWLTAGPAAAGVGAVMIVGLYSIGVLPQWNAARIRWAEQREFEEKILMRIDRMERRVAGRAEGSKSAPRPAHVHSTRPFDWFSARTMRAARMAAFGLLFAGACIVLFVVL